MTGLHLCYYQKASEQLQLGVEFETSVRLMEAQASIGYQVDIPKADLVFKGMLFVRLIPRVESWSELPFW